ncbi:hypothetical protein D917_04078 [Trichinella nativa]|uniref:Uncharacterized protein n=1 Tax=Trichinella nativa TaxID=6335 RepID=A0A1Y3E5M7_9BILA|nr:hypothetical protein D917_04078 [Trichinella nativa]
MKFYLKYQNSYFVFALIANNFDLANISRSIRFTKSVQQAALKSNTMINQIMIRNGAVVQFSQYISVVMFCVMAEAVLALLLLLLLRKVDFFRYFSKAASSVGGANITAGRPLELISWNKIDFSWTSLKILIKPCPNLLAFIWSTSGLLHPRVLRSAGLSPEIPYVEGRFSMFRNNAHHDWMDWNVVELALLPQQQL